VIKELQSDDDIESSSSSSENSIIPALDHRFELDLNVLLDHVWVEITTGEENRGFSDCNSSHLFIHLSSESSILSYKIGEIAKK